MATVVLEAKIRDGVGTGAARNVRNDNFVPCVVYGGGAASEPICISKDQLNKYVNREDFFSTVFEINGIGKKGQQYLAKETQFHPVTDQIMHVDFMRVDKHKKITVRIPMKFVHPEASPALKLGGVLNVLTREVAVVCAPDHVPQCIEFDLTGFEFHHAAHAFDLKLPEGVSLPGHVDNYTIATIVAPTSLKKEAKAAADAAAAEATKTDTTAQ